MESENIKKEIIRNLEKISGKYSMYEVFSDWIKCGALAGIIGAGIRGKTRGRSRMDLYGIWNGK